MLHGAHYAFRQMSASANVKPSQGVIAGILCQASSSGVISVYDDSSTGTAVPVATSLALTAGTYYPMPAALANGLYVVVNSGTATFTVFYR